MIAESSLCALGKLTPSPVRSTLIHFRDEYLAHIRERRCPAGKCTALVHSRCVNSCPAGVDVPAYLTLVSEGKYAEALAVHRERNPFAAICGRVCPAFCEQKCRRGEIDAPVAVRQVKRFMADQELMNPWTPERMPSRGKKVAVIGAGPAGLTAALRLAQWGYEVIVHEALPVAGGMMAVGIPDYRLPKDVLRAEVEHIQRAGVEIKLNSRLGRDFVGRPDRARRLPCGRAGVGAHKDRRLGVPGEEREGVISATGFLRDVALGSPPRIEGQRVAVVGGGDTAIDAARTALRLGASEVHLLVRRTRGVPALAERWTRPKRRACGCTSSPTRVSLATRRVEHALCAPGPGRVRR